MILNKNVSFNSRHMERIPDSSQYILFALRPDSSNKSASRTIGLYDVAQELWMPQVTVSTQ